MLPIELIGIIMTYLEYADIAKIVENIAEYATIIQKFGKQFNVNITDKTINDDKLKYFKGVHTIDLSECNQITDHGCEFLKGGHTIDLSGCKQITDRGCKFLTGVHTINL